LVGKIYLFKEISMSLFDSFSSVRSQSSTALGPVEAFAAIALVAVAVDGHLSEAEIRTISTTLSRMQLFRSYPNEVLGRMFEKLATIMQRQGTDTLLRAAISALPYELHETAFAVATDIVLADGEVTDEEETILNWLCGALSIPQNTALKIIEVMLIKNKG
jgi:tellurite resistance protein